MADQAVGHLLEDGSWLLVDGLLLEPNGSSPSAPVPGSLGAAEFLAAAVVAGVAGNLTYDVLRQLAAKVVEATGLTRSLSADEIADSVVLFLLSNGYTSAQVLDLVELRDRGWHMTGTVDGVSFTARADKTGRVVHLVVLP